MNFTPSSSFHQRRWRHHRGGGGDTEMSALQEERFARMATRRNRSVSIRKRRREETLRRKRGINITTTNRQMTNDNHPMMDNNNNNNDDNARIMTHVESYIQNPMDIERCSQLRNALLLSTTATKSQQWCLDRSWLKENNAKATALIQGLIQNLLLLDCKDELSNPILQEHALTILLHILESDSSVSDTTITTNNYDDDDDEHDYSYYGHASVTWSDQIISTTTDTTNTQYPDDVISAIFRLLHTFQSTKEEPMNHPQNNIIMIRLAFLVVSDLVWDSPHFTLPKIVVPRHWACLVRYLPHSSYCCASILRQDQIHYGMDFLQELRPQIIAKLLSSSSDDTINDDDSTPPSTVVVEAAWMIEGLSRREDAAIDCLVQQQESATSSSSDSSLVVACFLRQLQYLTTTANYHSEFWFPALNAICNMTTACEGRYVEFFLRYPGFVSIINHLLEHRDPVLLPTVVSVANGFLIDAGWPGHASTEIAAPNFVPRLVSILVAAATENCRWECKRDIVHAMVNAVVLAPPAAPSASSPSFTRTTIDAHDPPLQTGVGSTLQSLLKTWVWNILEQSETTTHSNFSPKDLFLQVLLDLLTKSHHDPDVVGPTLQLVDRILRTIPGSRRSFERLGGVRVLEEGVISFVSGPSSHLVAALLDDDELWLSDSDAEQDLEIVEKNVFVTAAAATTPQVVHNQFVFGSSALNASVPIHGPLFSTDTMSHRDPPAHGRGRGRVVPAWMQQQPH